MTVLLFPETFATRVTLEATVPGMEDKQFQQIAEEAKRNCPLSKALAAVPEITLQATLKN